MIVIKKYDVAEAKVFSMTDIQDSVEFLGDILQGVIVADDCAYFVFKSDDNTVLCEVLDGVVIENCLCIKDNDVIIRTQNGKVSVMAQQDFSEHYVVMERSEHVNSWN